MIDGNSRPAIVAVGRRDPGAALPPPAPGARPPPPHTPERPNAKSSSREGVCHPAEPSDSQHVPHNGTLHGTRRSNAVPAEEDRGEPTQPGEEKNRGVWGLGGGGMAPALPASACVSAASPLLSSASGAHSAFPPPGGRNLGLGWGLSWGSADRERCQGKASPMPQGCCRSGHTGKDVRAMVLTEDGSARAPRATGKERDRHRHRLSRTPAEPWSSTAGTTGHGLHPCPSGKPSRRASAAVAGPSGHVGFCQSISHGVGAGASIEIV